MVVESRISVHSRRHLPGNHVSPLQHQIFTQYNAKHPQRGAFYQCCVNKKKVVSTFNLDKNFLYIFPMFVFDKYWVNFAKLFSIKFDKLFNHISPNQDIFSSQLQSWWRRKPKSDCYQFTQQVYFPQRALFLSTKLSPGKKLFFIIYKKGNFSVISCYVFK